MAGTCDVCGAKLGLMKFRCEDGVICKECYDLASQSCTTTIRKMSLEDVRTAADRRRAQLDVKVDFMPTKRVGDILQVDERHKLIALPHNRRMAGQLEAPEFIAWEDLRSCGLVSTPERDDEELATLAAGDGEAETISKLSLWIQTTSRAEPYLVPLIASPVKTDGFAFRQSHGLAIRALALLEQICPGEDRDPPKLD